jgi:nucleotide-binding universal stress UspA family protein
MRTLIAHARRTGVAPPDCCCAALRTGDRARGPIPGAGQIVIGTHGRSGVSRLILGSVAAKVIAAASCPTLVVPAARKAGKR